MHGVKAQQVGIGLDRAEIVDADHLDVLALALNDGAQHIAPDATKTLMKTRTVMRFLSC